MGSKPRYKIGERIQNRWEIYDLKSGGMGNIYIVYDHDPEFCEVFAAKTFQDEVFMRYPHIADLFRQEAEAWINLDIHQNVTQARYVDIIDDKPFLFLEYVSGGDLSHWIGTPRLTKNLPQTLRFAIQFCHGMIHVLSKGVKVHRDIKPQNCLVTEDATLKVTDFGLAKVFDKTHPERLESGAIGTPAYMAPEQFDEAKYVDVRADIYSFGVMLFQMVTGQLPFLGRTLREFAQQHQTAPLPSLKTGPSQLDAVIHTCLAKDPASRFADFDIVGKQLTEIYETLTNKPLPSVVKATELDAIDSCNKGVSLSQLGRHEEALKYYDDSIRRHSRFAKAWNNKGVALMALRRYNEALTCHNRALEINPDDEKAWDNKGVVLVMLGQMEDALACYDRATQLNPHNHKTWGNKGALLETLGQISQALIFYNHALELNPHYSDAQINKGNALDKLGRKKEALKCYDEVIQMNPRNAKAWLNKGVALEQTEEALACINRALELDSHYAEAWFNKGAVLGNWGQIREALVCFEEAQRLGISQATQMITFCRWQLGEW